MSLLLASVTSIEEARIALERGADVIDLKNPAQGALGALPIAAIEQVTKFVAGRKLVSATVGDPPMPPDSLLHAVTAVSAAGPDIVKIGFTFSPGHQECVQALRTATGRGIKLIAVLFADGLFSNKGIPLNALADFAEAGFYGVMLDTADKNGKGLRDYLSQADIADFVEEGHRRGLLVGLAGSLQYDDIAPLSALRPDYMGFRGALCVNLERTASMESQRVQKVREMLRQNNETNRLAA